MKEYTKDLLASYLDHAVLDPAMNLQQLRDNIMIGVNAKCHTVCVNPDAIELAKSNYTDGMTSEDLVVCCLKNMHK